MMKKFDFNLATMAILEQHLGHLLQILEIHDVEQNSTYLKFSCPVHGGDNETGCTLYLEGSKTPGSWQCHTRGCNEHFGAGLYGLIRGTLSHQEFGWEFRGDQETSKKKAANIMKELAKEDGIRVEKIKPKPVTKKDVHRFLNIPSAYFLKRGYSANTLKHFLVGDPKTPKQMWGRAVVPIFDEFGIELKGCTGRSTFPKCDLCGFFHSPGECMRVSKWKHSKGFSSGSFLYNYANAKPHIEKSRYVILVESPGNVWRFYEAGFHNVVGIFGCTLTEIHKSLISRSGTTSIVTAFDNDSAGHEVTQKLYEFYQQICPIYQLKFSGQDIGEMSAADIILEIKPQLENWRLL